MTNLLIELEYFKKLWVASMPPSIELPPDHTFMAWLTCVPKHGLEHAVTKTARRMSSNINRSIQLVENAAVRYCSSIVGNWRKANDEDAKRARDLAASIARDFYQMEGFDFTGDNVDPRYHAVRRQREVFTQSSKALVLQLIRDGKSDAEIRRYLHMMQEWLQGNFKSAVLPPLPDGATRLSFNQKEFIDWYADTKTIDKLTDDHDIVIRLGADGKFAVDLLAKSTAEVR